MKTKTRNGADKPATLEEIKAQAELTKRSVKQTARELVDRITGGGWLKVDERKQAAASHLDTATTAVLDAVSKLRKDDQEVVARPLVSLANSLGHAGYFLDSKSPSELAEIASDTVRRHPVACLGGALVLGVAAARIVRASSKT